MSISENYVILLPQYRQHVLEVETIILYFFNDLLRKKYNVSIFVLKIIFIFESCTKIQKTEERNQSLFYEIDNFHFEILITISTKKILMYLHQSNEFHQKFYSLHIFLCEFIYLYS